MKKYKSLAKRTMLKNKYVNNTFAYYKKMFFSFVFSIAAISLCVTLSLNLSKIKTKEVNPRVLIVGDLDPVKHNEFIAFKNGQDDFDLLIYESRAFLDNFLYIQELQSYKIPIYIHGHIFIEYKMTCIIFDEYGNVKFFKSFDVPGETDEVQFYTVDEVKTILKELGW